MGRYEIAKGIEGVKLEAVEDSLPPEFIDPKTEYIEEGPVPTPPYAGGIIRIISAPGITEDELANLREQVDMAYADPNFSIITNYNVVWQEVQRRT